MLDQGQVLEAVAQAALAVVVMELVIVELEALDLQIKAVAVAELARVAERLVLVGQV